MGFQWLNVVHKSKILWLKTERNEVDFAVDKYLRDIRNYIAIKHVAYSSTGSTSVLIVYIQVSWNEKGRLAAFR